MILPDELLVAIVARCPASVAMRLRRTCQQWFRVTTSDGWRCLRVVDGETQDRRETELFLRLSAQAGTWRHLINTGKLHVPFESADEASRDCERSILLKCPLVFEAIASSCNVALEAPRSEGAACSSGDPSLWAFLCSNAPDVELYAQVASRYEPLSEVRIRLNLLAACERAHCLPLVRLLIHSLADPSWIWLDEEQEAIQTVVLSDAPSVLPLFLEVVNSDAARSTLVNEALNHAAVRAADDTVKHLLEHYNPTASAQSHALRCAVCVDRASVVDVLLHAPYSKADPSEAECAVLEDAAKMGSSHSLELLLRDPRVDVHQHGVRALSLACDYGHVDAARVLLACSRVDSSSLAQCDALIGAADNGHVDVVTLLLSDRRVDPTARMNEALSCARHSGHQRVVQKLLGDSRVRNFEDRFF